MALSYYHLIPESVYTITSVSTRRTYRFKTPLAEFNYRSIKPQLFFGYKLAKYGNKHFKMASIEKAVLDYFYINPDIRTKNDFASLRINKDEFFKQVNEKKLYELLDKFTQKTLTKRIKAFWELMESA